MNIHGEGFITDADPVDCISSVCLSVPDKLACRIREALKKMVFFGNNS